MVEILRDQMRKYDSDQSGAIRMGQLAQNVGEWNSVIQKVGNMVESYQKEKIAADETMINTEIGETGKTQLMEWNAKQIEAGVDPSSDAYKEKLYAERDRIYQPLIDKMGTQKGRETMQKQALDVGEKIRQANIGKIAQNRKRAQAQGAYIRAQNQIKTDAQEFGKLGDWEGFQEATKPARDAMLKYAKAQGGESAKANAELNMDLSNMLNFLGGMAQEDPETVLTMLDDKDSLKSIVYEQLDKQNPGMSVAEKEKEFQRLYDKVGQKASADEQLSAIMPDSVRDAFVKHYQTAKQQEQRDLRERLKTLPKGSRARKDVEEQIKATQEQIDDPDAGALELLRGTLNRSPIRDQARKQLELNRLAQKKADEDNFVSMHVAAISPDSMTRFEARSNLALVPMAKKRMDAFWNSDKITPQGFQDIYNDYLEEDKKVLENTEVTFKGTEALATAVNKALQSGEKPAVERTADMFAALTELHKTPGLTQGEFEHTENILHAGMVDQVFGDMVSKVLKNPNRYFPDTTWLTNIMNPMKVGTNVSKDTLGLPATTRDTDVDRVKSYLESNAIRITDTAVAMLSQASQLPTTQARQAAVQEVENYIAKEKQSCYDYAMKTFGIDLAKLRAEKQKTGRAFTQIGWRVKEYLGDDPDGNPLFENVLNREMYNTVAKRIQDGLEASKAAGVEQPGAERAVKAYNKVKNRL